MLIISENRRFENKAKKANFEQISTCQNQNDDYICTLDILKKYNN